MFLQQFSPTTGKMEWIEEDEDYEMNDEIARFVFDAIFWRCPQCNVILIHDDQLNHFRLKIRIFYLDFVCISAHVRVNFLGEGPNEEDLIEIKIFDD